MRVVLWGDWAGGAGSGVVVADKLGVDGDLCCGVGLWMLDVGTWGGGGLLDEVDDLLFVFSCC